MDISQEWLQGTVKPDGSLELEKPSSLPPGPVAVLLRAEGAGTTTETWWEYLERGRAELLAQGHQFRSRGEIDAEVAARRAQEEARRTQIERLQGDQE